MIPNYIRNHSTAIDQALYFNMKSYAGDNGTCFVSKRNLASKMGIGRTALTKSIKYLIDHKWIAEVGFKTIKTSGGDQKVSVYRINDIWALNQAFYSQGGSETAPLSDSKVGLKQQGGGSETATKKIDNKEDRTAISKKSQIPASSLSDSRYDSVADLAPDGSVETESDKPENIHFNFEAFLNGLRKSKNHAHKTVALYWVKKGIRPENFKQAKQELGKDLKYASGLSGYTGEQILNAINVTSEHAEELKYDWSLKTVSEKISRININN
jgi:hypothetical protein